ncbi:MAG: hypothetical protein IJD22_01810 [Clostridia bacterium]|nr:hypothetical protein [Clostridia bacterium]
MKAAKHVKGQTKAREKIVSSAPFIAAICFILAALLLAFTAADCEKYTLATSCEASVTFTPPRDPEPLGFWDIFSSAVAGLLKTEG